MLNTHTQIGVGLRDVCLQCRSLHVVTWSYQCPGHYNYVSYNYKYIAILPSEGKKCSDTTTEGVADKETGEDVGWLAKWTSAMSKSFAISSTGFKGGAPAGARADFRVSIHSLNAAIVPVLLKVSWRAKRGPRFLRRWRCRHWCPSSARSERLLLGQTQRGLMCGNRCVVASGLRQ